jgi:hypothetical protein
MHAIELFGSEVAPHARAMHAIELFGSEVAPEVRAALQATAAR